MNTKNTLSVSEARKKFFEIIEKAQKPDNYFVLTLKGKPKAVLMSSDDFECWQETLETYQDFPDLQKSLREAQTAFETGAYKKFTSIEEMLFKEGFVLADKGNSQYEVQSQHSPRSRKRNKTAQRKR